MRLFRLPLILLLLLGLSACSVMPSKGFPREHDVNIDRYMGPWYVIALIPPSVTSNAYNSIERYTHGSGNRINVKFTYRDGSFDGDPEHMEPTGFVIPDTGNAVWGMQFFWPLKMQFVISYVSPDYRTTIVAREKRDYVWIMARTPRIDDATYRALVKRVGTLGYDTGKLHRVPQQPLDQRDDL